MCLQVRRKAHEVFGVVVATTGGITVVAPHLEFFLDQVQQHFRHGGVVNQPYRLCLLALLQRLCHPVNDVAGHIFTQLQFGIATDLESEGHGLFDGQHTPEHIYQTGADYVVEHDVYAFVQALSRRDGNKARQDVGGYFEAGKPQATVFQFQIDPEVNTRLIQKRHGLAIIDKEGFQFRQHLLVEVGLHIRQLFLCQLALVDQVNMVPPKVLEDFQVGVIEPRLQSQHFFIDTRQHLGKMLFFLAAFGKCGKATHIRDPNTIKFIQIVGEDAEEAYPLNDGHTFILYLLQHTGIEGKPAEFFRIQGNIVCHTGCNYIRRRSGPGVRFHGGWGFQQSIFHNPVPGLR